MFVWGEEGGWCVCVSACACAYVCVCAWVLLCVCTQHIRACHVIVIVIVCVCMLCLRESAFVLHSALGHVVWLCACACACVYVCVCKRGEGKCCAYKHIASCQCVSVRVCAYVHGRVEFLSDRKVYYKTTTNGGKR